MSELVLVLDYGGQYKEMIARSVRALSVYSEIHPGSLTAEQIKAMKPIGIILTGGPDSVSAPGAPSCDPDIFKLGIPVLGICYGMHLMCHTLGGEVKTGEQGEYGCVPVTGEDGHTFTALMSHRDAVVKLPKGFQTTAHTDCCAIAACECPEKKLYCTQFHPESRHTEKGLKVMEKFLYEACGAKGGYNPEDTISAQTKEVRARVGNEKVLLALSGGVDSSVCAALLSKAIPGQLVCIFVDHGFMRLNEGDEIEQAFAGRDLQFIRVNAEKRFLAKLKGVTDPEKKRKIIGEEFIKVFEEEAAKLGDIPYLAQGTIYPDIVESGGQYGATIKSHHNVGGLPEKMNFKGIIEPLRGLFKDEVRILGKKLKLPKELVQRQPFPGPGLAIRVMGEVTKDRLDLLRQADFIFRDEVSRLRKKPQQYFAVLTNTRAVGVKGDDRTYDYVIAIRAVTTTDFMTAECANFSYKTLGRISARITSEIAATSRVVYDITSKPPGTVEWE